MLCSALLGPLMCVSVGDLGLAETRSDTATASMIGGGWAGSPAYVAPELFDRTAKNTTASDVYALGILMWTVCTGELTPYCDLRLGLLENRVCRGLRPNLKLLTPMSVRLTALLQRCWHDQPKKRPDCATILSELQLCMTDSIAPSSSHAAAASSSSRRSEVARPPARRR
jgi:serine/threonine protein kinase